MAERRDLRPEEMAVILELAMATPDLVAAKDRMLAALAAPVGSGLALAAGTMRPTTMKELLEAVKLGVLRPEQARRFVAVPQPEPGLMARMARLRWQKGVA